MTDEIKVVSGFYYTKEHEWAKPQEDGTVLVGIDDYAQGQLHEIVYVELPKVESDVVQGKSIGAVESVKAVSDMFSPISGKIIEVNQDLLDNPDKINKDPYGEGWIAKIQPTNLETDLAKLYDSEKYKTYLGTLKH
ncbi:glycine cleavage system protein GcvH [Candidatus Bathyarchaeota archaeon]|nr:glycine cleavage system protein GcvH [Candidatus Bathyarchaeota archaeon]